MNEHTQIVMWIVGTGMGVVIAFVTVLTVAIGGKVDVIMCNKIHQMLDKTLSEMSSDAKKTMEHVISINLSLENLKGMLKAQIETEADRWDRTEVGKKG